MKNKHYTLLLVAILFFSTAIAQPRIKAQAVIGGNNYDNFSSMYLTKDGGLIVGGTSNSPVSNQKTENSKGGDDCWIIKGDSNRTIQWDKTIGGSGDDGLSAIQQTKDGGYIAGGYSYSNASGDKTENNRGGSDYWIVKLDSAGNVQWDKTVGGNSNDFVSAIQQTRDGGYIVGGSSGSDKSGDKTENSRGYTDYWIIKLDSIGNIQWQKTIGGADYEFIASIQQTADGGYIAGGQSGSNISGQKTENSRGLNDYWIVKLDASGNIQWDKTIGGSGDENFNALEQTTDGGYILGGQSNSNTSGEKTENNKGLYDYWVVKLDAAGNIQWDKTIGGNNYDDLNTLEQTTDGGYILGGASNSSSSGDKTENSRGGSGDYGDYWIVKISRNGNVQWDKTIGGNSTDNLLAIREIKKNDYVAGGWSYSGISGDKTGANRGMAGSNDDYWLVELKYVRPDSVAIMQAPTSRLAAPLPNSTAAFSVFPNPATMVLHIQNVGKATFMLSDLSGKRMLSKTIEGNGDLKVANLPAGTYYLTNITTGITQKIVITK